MSKDSSLSRQPRIVRFGSELRHFRSHAIENLAMRGIGSQVAHFCRILSQIVELLGRTMQKRLQRARPQTHAGPRGDCLPLSLIHISEPTRLLSTSYAVF